MEKNEQIEENINAALESAKRIKSSELPPDFSDTVMSSLRSPTLVSPNYQLLRAAAIFILIFVNIWTLRLLFDSQPKQNQATVVSIKDFVNEYQVNDANEEVVTINKVNHE